MTIIYQYMHRPNNTELGKATQRQPLYTYKSRSLICFLWKKLQSYWWHPGTYQLKSASHKEFRVNQ